MIGDKVVHGWLPEDEQTKLVMQKLTYNDAVEMVALADELEMRLNESHDNNIEPQQQDLLFRAGIVKVAPVAVWREGWFLILVSQQRFLESSPSQLTFEGLFKIHAALEEDELAVLFRNNHFSTVLKRRNVLYTLVTDVGFIHRDEVVWETLDCLNGDTRLVNCDFASPPPQSAASQHSIA